MRSTRLYELGWEAHARFLVLLIPISPINGPQYRKCCRIIEILCRNAIPLKALGIPDDLGSPWNSGVARCATITFMEKKRLPRSWSGHERPMECILTMDPVGCVRAVIGFQTISPYCDYVAEHLAVTFAADTLGINVTSVASAAIYLSPGGIPFSLNEGNLSITS